MDSGSAPAANPNLGAAAAGQADIAAQQQNIATQTYANAQPQLRTLTNLANQYVQSQVASQQQQTQLANTYQQRMQGTFYPIQDTLAFDSLGYYDASPAAQAKIEQAYVNTNTNQINNTYQQQIQALQSQYNQGQSQFQQANQFNAGQNQDYGSKISALQNTIGTQQSAIAAEQARAASDDGGFLQTAFDVGTGTYGALDGVMGWGGNTTANTAGLQSSLGQNQAQLTKLQAQQDLATAQSTADARANSQYQVNPATGNTYAQDQLNQQIGALKTQQTNSLQGVNDSLATVKAYADTYKSSQDNLAGQARQDVASQFDQRSAQTQRQLQSYGVDPTSGRFAQSLNQNNITQAAASAQAMNQARAQAKQLGWAQRMDASGLGNGLPGSQATSTQLAQSAGQQQLAGQSSIINGYQNAGTNYLGGLSQVGSTYSQLGNLGYQQSQLANQQYATNASQNAALYQGLGQLAGTAAGAYFGGPLGAAAGGQAGKQAVSYLGGSGGSGINMPNLGNQ